eukprot:434790-Prorocentrum_lima.AAC.1
MSKSESLATPRHGFNSPFVPTNDAPAPRSPLPDKGSASSHPTRTLGDSRCLRVLSGFNSTHRKSVLEFIRALPGPSIKAIRPLALYPKMAM